MAADKEIKDTTEEVAVAEPRRVTSERQMRPRRLLLMKRMRRPRSE
jgi:hypothetical protein